MLLRKMWNNRLEVYLSFKAKFNMYLMATELRMRVTADDVSD